MQIRLLGPLEVVVDGRPIDLGDLQQRFIFVVLVLNANKPISVERLIGTVWANPPKTNLVPGYITKLRKAFQGTDGLSISRQTTGYVLHVDVDRIDMHRFHRLCAEAEAAADPRTRLTKLREAVGLWRGKYLEDIDTERVGASELISPAERYVDAVTDLAELEVVEGNHRWARDHLRPLFNADPTRQRVALVLMRALTANGDRAKAMDVYFRCRDALDEYGMEASTDLRRQARLTQHTGGASRVPAGPRRFAGRAAELEVITSAALTGVAAQRPAVVWVSGTPGIGKSAVALQAVQGLRRHFPDGQLFVQLNGFTPNMAPVEPMEALAQLLVQLDVAPEQLPASLGERAALYQASLADTRTLVVLDNAADEKAVELLLPDAPGCLALVTSRSVATLAADAAVHLEPLPLPDAAAMFADLVGAVRTDAWPLLVDDVVQRCGRIPLLIKVAAAQFRQHHRWPLDHLVQLLDDAGAEAGTDSPIAVAERAACTVSYQQLSDAQRTLFRLIGQLPGPDLTVRAAAALLHSTIAEARALLAELQSVSLIEEVAPERYLMLDPLKEFAGTLSRAAWPDELTEALDRWLDFHLVTSANAMNAAFPRDRDHRPEITRVSPVAAVFADAAAAREWLDAERFTLLAAVKYAAEHDRGEHTWQLAVLLWRWHFTRGYVADWAETLELARETLDATGTDRQGLAYVLLRLSGARRQAGEQAEALALVKRALALWEDLDDERGQAAALANLAIATYDDNDYGAAREYFEAALTKFEALDDRRGQAHALSNLGTLDELRGELRAAHERQRAATEIFRDLDYPQGLAHALDNLGAVQRQLGLLDEAMASHQEAHQLAVELGDRVCEAYALNNLGNVHRCRGELAEALTHHEKARAVADLVRDPGLGAQLYLDRAATHHASGDDDAALTAYRATLDLAAGTGDRGQQAHAHHGIARVLHTLGRHDEAAAGWRAAIDGFTDLEWSTASTVRAELAENNCACAQ
ncbi:AfsR/SARP family transcriptional regulator [Labedaea rhizosphaerae]|uniref:DNA-binding SARP family transcriptional activator n=1 Tax=Labedaea rhizosphaerae TaxID=598644 RepID=A0A4R6SDJ4_LABRH|nr:tetratricopeptide repeat protein [Labedaea rhizosphaerae]TDP97991.1 DNA-binding SARP family transcriptional activator [Labedaea rhizosphaerae]